MKVKRGIRKSAENMATFKGKTLLITGGTGSFGNAVLSRFLKEGDVKEIRIFSRDEKKQHDMRQIHSNPNIKYFIGDVRDRGSLDSAMYGADIVFHAAALKHVPSCEFFPMEAVRTNVIGCENVLDSALKHNVKKVVTLSTDKAVYPVNAMGMSKALAEKTMIAKSRNLNGTNTVFCGTRYGNVMATRGSVIPLFVNQIKKGEPITITNPEMTRFMMSLDESLDLVIFAFKNGSNGDIFVQKAPATTLETLARALKELYQSEVPITYIGTRHGEKVCEALVSREEMVRAEELKSYYKIPSDARDLNYALYISDGEEKIKEVEEYTSHNTKRLDLDETKKLLLKLDFVRDDLAGKHTEILEVGNL